MIRHYDISDRVPPVTVRDCNPGLEFSIPGFGIVEFPIPGSRDPAGIGGVQLGLLKLPRGLYGIRVAIFELGLRYTSV